MIEALGHFFSSSSNREMLGAQLVEHVYLALLPLLLGLLVAVPLGRFVLHLPWLRGPLQAVAGAVYTVPSLALFVLIPGIVGTPLLSPINVVLALSLYTAALLIRPVVDALEAVPAHVLSAATALGYRPVRRFFAVELPLSLPVLTSGARVASVSNISLVSVGALVGVGGLGQLFTDGYQRDYLVQIVIGILGIVLLALLVDLVLVAARWVLTPWSRDAGGSGRGGG